MRLDQEQRLTISTDAGSLVDGTYTAIDYRGGVVDIRDIGLTTPDQTRVLVWGALGATIDETAGFFGKSNVTIRRYRDGGFDALKARNMAHGVQRSFELGMLSVRFGVSLPGHDIEFLERRSELITCKAEGMTNAEASRALGLTARTAKQYCSDVMNKLDAPNMAAAVMLCHINGILSAGPESQAPALPALEAASMPDAA